jgi:hypothetical protein
MLCNEDLNEKIRVNDGKIQITKREYVARYYEKFVNNIRGMKWVTKEQWYVEKNKVCPRCGSDKLDTD